MNDINAVAETNEEHVKTKQFPFRFSLKFFFFIVGFSSKLSKLYICLLVLYPIFIDVYVCVCGRLAAIGVFYHSLSLNGPIQFCCAHNVIKPVLYQYLILFSKLSHRTPDATQTI